MNPLMILTLAVTHFFVLIVPSPDILLILRTSLASGYKEAIAASFGVGCGIVIWIFLTVLGLNALFLAFPAIQILLMITSSLYLLYLGVGILRSLKSGSSLNLNGKATKGGLRKFFITGFFTNLSNPKAVLYFASVFSVFVSSLDSLWQLLGVAFFISFESLCVFLLVGKIFSSKKPREIFLNNQKILDAVCGAIFIVFALLIAYECYQKIQG